MKKFLRLWQDQSGATAIEYGLIVALIVIVVIGGIQSVGVSTNLNGTFSTVTHTLSR